MLLPITFYLEPVTALIMLAGIYYGAQLAVRRRRSFNIPGESTSVVTTLDGHEMARQGRAGAALAVAGFSSFFAGTVSVVVIAVLAQPLRAFALTFGAADNCSLMVLGLVAAVGISRGTGIKGLAVVAFGVLLGMIGTDIQSGVQRFTFGVPELADGLEITVVAVGMFGLGSTIVSVERREHTPYRPVFYDEVRELWPTREEVRRSWPAAVRGTCVGCVLGVLPAGGPVLSSFAAYAVERKIAKSASRLGKGATEPAWPAPEAANNAAAQTAFIPMLTLGIPSHRPWR